MEQVHLGEVVQEQAEVQEWVDLVREERVAPEQVQARLENAYAPNVERWNLMMLEYPVTLRNVLNVVHQW